MLNGKNGSATYIVDNDYRIIYFDKGLEQYFPRLETGKYCYECLRCEERPCQHCPKKGNKRRSAVFCDALGKWLDVECIYLNREDKDAYTILNLKEVEEYGTSIMENGIYTDIYIKDSVTGLLLKKYFMEQVSNYIKKHGVEGKCIVSMDIKQFKLYNEVYGQEAGDFILKKIGRYIRELERISESIGGYFGSDDFMIFMPDDKNLIEQLYNTVYEYVAVYEQKAGFAPVVGIYIIEQGDEDVDAMCNNAQIASDIAKTRYDKSICYFSSDMEQDIKKKQRIFNGIRRGLENEEFTFFLQPKCDITTGKIVSMEALVRWIHPEQGLLPPAEYIPILEESGLIVELDKYVWEKVCKEIKHWKEEGLKVVPVSVNISIIDIKSMDVPTYLKELTDKYEIGSDNLAVEITETEFAKNSDILKDMVNRLHDMGFRILLDDFGSGYSSLNILKDINIDILKMDMKFLDLDENNLKRGRNILESVLRMAHAMDMWVIAEGVENKIHVDVLTALGCAYGQGYYFYRPMPIEQMEKLLQNVDNVDDSGVYIKKQESLKNMTFGTGEESAENNGIHKEMVKAITDIYFKILKGNLTDDTFEVIKVADKESALAHGAIHKCSEWFSMFGMSENIYKKDRKKFLEVTDINNLRVHFKNGNYRLGLRYRRKYGDMYRWVILEIFKDTGYTDDNQVVMIYVRDIHDEYVAELYQRRQLEYMSNYDALTKVYNRSRFENDIIEFSEESFNSVACVYMDAIGLHELNNHLGHKAGDEMLCYIADTIQRYFTKAKVYRIGGDEFVILCFDKEYADILRSVGKIKDELTHKEYGISVGIMWNDNCNDLQELINQAEENMRADKRRYYMENGKERQQRTLNHKLEEMLMKKKDAEQFLKIIAPKYKGVYFVNIVTDEVRYIYIPEYFAGILRHSNNTYQKAIRMYMEQYIDEQYRDNFIKMCDYGFLREELTKKDFLEYTFMKKDGSYITLEIHMYEKDNPECVDTIWIFSEKDDAPD